jgi:hypothetical protein
MTASKEPDYVIAHQILTELLIRHQRQNARLQAVLGVSENFESVVESLWQAARRTK